MKLQQELLERVPWYYVVCFDAILLVLEFSTYDNRYRDIRRRSGKEQKCGRLFGAHLATTAKLLAESIAHLLLALLHALLSLLFSLHRLLVIHGSRHFLLELSLSLQPFCHCGVLSFRFERNRKNTGKISSALHFNYKCRRIWQNNNEMWPSWDKDVLHFMWRLSASGQFQYHSAFSGAKGTLYPPPIRLNREELTE